MAIEITLEQWDAAGTYARSQMLKNGDYLSMKDGEALADRIKALILAHEKLTKNQPLGWPWLPMATR